ncbi:MAG: MFS transporter [Ancalomicrobiaceae bacterium]|nr:MFS transporter [Ancalomicrobiaceae bacterium]
MLTQFFAFGIAAGQWSGTVPTVAAASGVDSATLGLAFTAFTAAYILSMTFGGPILARLPNRPLLIIGNVASAAAVSSFVISASPIALFVSLVGIGVAMGFLDLTMNSEGAQVEVETGRPKLARLHGCASAGSALGAIVGSALALTVGTWASIVACCLAHAGAVVVVYRLTPERVVRTRAERKASGGFPGSLGLIILGIVFGIGVSGESAANMWSARLLDEQAPQLAVIAGIGISFFAGCQAIVRFSGDQLRRHFSDRTLIAACLTVAAVGFAIIGQSSGFAMSVVGFALVGFGSALTVPCVFALSVAASPGHGGAALSYIAAVAGLPRILSPWAFGLIAGQFSTGTAFGLIAAALIVAVVLSQVRGQRAALQRR